MISAAKPRCVRRATIWSWTSSQNRRKTGSKSRLRSAQRKTHISARYSVTGAWRPRWCCMALSTKSCSTNGRARCISCGPSSSHTSTSCGGPWASRNFCRIASSGRENARSSQRLSEGSAVKKAGCALAKSSRATALTFRSPNGAQDDQMSTESRTGSWSASRSQASGDIFPNVLILRMHQLVRGAIEDNLSLSQDEKCSVQIALGAFGQRQHLVLLGIEIRAGHNEGVLQAVRDHQRAGFVDVALLHDELDDAGGSN